MQSVKPRRSEKKIKIKDCILYVHWYNCTYRLYGQQEEVIVVAKTERFEIRLSKDQREELERMAGFLNITVTEYVIDRCLSDTSDSKRPAAPRNVKAAKMPEPNKAQNKLVKTFFKGDK
jgi:hypothetical protein